MMAVDGVDSQTLRETLEVAIGEEEHHGEDSGKVMEAFGGYAPTIGIIGAVLGLIHVMSNLSDINAVGKGIAGAFVATIYGVAFANIVCLPLGTRTRSVRTSPAPSSPPTTASSGSSTITGTSTTPSKATRRSSCGTAHSSKKT